MNGRFPAALLSDETLSNRMFAALMASCVLHAAVIVMPYFGASVTVPRAATMKPAPNRAIQVRFLTEAAPAAAGPENPTVGASPADLKKQRLADEELHPAAERTLGTDLLPIRAPAYYTTDQLTRRPEPTSQPALLTSELGPSIPSGKVILKLWITEHGNVASVEVEKSELPEAISTTAAAAFGKLRFVPGQLNGRKVGSVMRIEVVYYDGAAGPPP